MVWYRKILDILKDYCLNCSLAGLSYVADSRLKKKYLFFIKKKKCANQK